jgi:hypothetical protein
MARQEFNYRVNHIAFLLGVSSDTLKNYLQREGLLSECVYKNTHLRIPITLARLLLGLNDDAPIPGLPKRKYTKRKRMTMKDLTNLKQSIGGL